MEHVMNPFIGSLMLAVVAAGMLGPANASPSKDHEQRIAVSVTSKGFEPSTIHARAGQPVVLVVTRKAEKTCAKEIVIKERKIRQTLPLNQAVEVRLAAQQPGSLRYACPMDMLSGTLIFR